MSTTETLEQMIKDFESENGKGAWTDAARAELDALKQKVERQRNALVVANAAFSGYFGHMGAVHVNQAGLDEPCPEDDTCDCPDVLAVNDAFRAMRDALEAKP